MRQSSAASGIFHALSSWWWTRILRFSGCGLVSQWIHVRPLHPAVHVVIASPEEYKKFGLRSTRKLDCSGRLLQVVWRVQPPTT